VQNFVAFNFNDLCQFGTLQMPFGTMVEIAIQALQNIFNARNQR
jgi:hypothetical protein